MSFFDELKRRNVVRVGIAYVVIGWALAQVAEFAVDNFHAPEWTLQIFVVFLLLGLPLVLFLAWAFEITPDGVKREQDVDRSQSIAPQTGRKLDRVIIGVLIIAIGFLLADKFYFNSALESEEVVAASGRQSIAVLPFVNMSDDKDYFADGLSEELLNLLAKTPGLKVAGRTSSFAFKGKQEDLRAIGTALGVATVLEGSVRRSGDRLRITAQLISVDNGFHLWSETYDRQMADVFDIQDDVAGAIAEVLKLQLAPDASRLTGNAEAYSFYVEALPNIANRTVDRLEIVIRLLDSAIAIDPRFAKAHEAKALAYWMSSAESIDGPSARQLVYESAKTALELDSTLVGARLFVATAGPDNLKRKNEFAAVEAAIKAAPNDFNIVRVLCFDLLSAGYLQESLQCANRMVELEPLSPLSHWRVAASLSALGRRDEARASWQRVIELGGTYYQWDIAVEELVAREFDAAIRTLEGAPPTYVWRAEDARRILQGVADADTGKDFLDAWVRVSLAGASNWYDINNVYYWYLALGYLDDYWRAIEEIGSRHNYVWSDADFLLHYGLAFRSTGFTRHPRFLAYAKSTGLTDLWDTRGAPDFCSMDSGEWVCE